MNNSKLGTNTISGYIDHLGIITDSGYVPGTVFIEGDSLSYIPNDNNESGEVIPILNNNSTFRPIRCSELHNSILRKVFFKQCLVYQEDEDTVKMKINPDSLQSDIPVITQKSLSELSKAADGISFNNEFGIEDMQEINSRYSELYSGEDKKGFDFLQLTTKNKIDLGDKYFSTTVISADSDVYTDTLNLNGIIRHCVSSELKGSANIDVRYSTAKGVFSENIVFSVFSYDQDLKLEVKNFIQDINDKVQVEYINGVLRVYPLDSTVNECIINNCILTYAKS